MSATPIPRTLAQVLYGDDLQLYSIKTKPGGRSPVRTGIAHDMEKVIDFILTEVNERGNQVYAVCPLITCSEKTEGIASAESVYEAYKEALERYGVTVGLVTGKTQKGIAAETLEKFERNEISVLVSTTVIEVGIDVPNATGIIIHNAERFGLAQLHQLRGRVGRGNDRGVCVLLSEDQGNKRLEALCATNDGFVLAEMDLQQRGSGDLLGSQQTGNEEYLSLALRYPEEYKAAQTVARYLIDSNEECLLFERAFRDYEQQSAE
jgi:ATP-dependent DNA helicase RecG